MEERSRSRGALTLVGATWSAVTLLSAPRRGSQR